MVFRQFSIHYLGSRLQWLGVKRALSGKYFIRFRIGRGEILTYAQTASKKEADHAVSVVEENLRLLERGRLEIPRGGGRRFLSAFEWQGFSSIAVNSLTLTGLFEKYFDSLP